MIMIILNYEYDAVLLDMIEIVEDLQVMPFQLGCVHCAGVILPAGG